MSESRDTIAVALVALVALSGLVLSGNGSGAASMEAMGANTGDRQLGYVLADQAYEMAKSAPAQQNRECSRACTDLCPSAQRWDPKSYGHTNPGGECADWCAVRCERLLVADYEQNYGRN